MRNKLGNALIALGVLALLAAVLLMGYNQWDSTRAEKAADSVLTQLEESIAEPRTIYPGDAAGWISENLQKNWNALYAA